MRKIYHFIENKSYALEHVINHEGKQLFMDSEGCGTCLLVSLGTIGVIALLIWGIIALLKWIAEDFSRIEAVIVIGVPIFFFLAIVFGIIDFFDNWNPPNG